MNTSADKEIDPSDIGKYPALIKVAQAEMARTDVLVCGKCHCVFHFVELFKEHKEIGCDRDSTLNECRETKPKVWAFLLWKSSQMNAEDAANANSWKLYQTWVKMDESLRETWIVAGRTIQSFGKMGQGNLQEMPVKITKTVMDASPNEAKKDFLPIKKPPILNRVPAAQNALKSLSPQNRITSKPAVQPQSRIAKRTVGEDSTDLDTVEKILAKRFNPRKKQYEYLVKWETLTHEQNTWEQLSHFDQCKHLLDHFEEQLARQKEQRAKFQQLQQNTVAKPVLNQSSPNANNASGNANTSNSSLSPNRPLRNSKSKAIDQVKQWCADEDTGVTAGGFKRKSQSSADDEDEDDPAADDLDDDFGFKSKKIKTDNPAVAQALLKAGQTGSVRIVQVNKNLSATSPNKTKVINGNTVKTVTPTLNDMNKNSADIVIAKDGKITSGVMKKPGVSITNKINQTEAKIRVLSKGEQVPSGVVRITPQNDPSKVLNKTEIQNSQTKTIISSQKSQQNHQSNIKIQQSIQKQTPKLTPTAKPSNQAQKTGIAQQKRFSLSPDTNTSVHNKTTITRITKSVPNSAKTTPESGSRTITYRTADGQLVRKSIPINMNSPREIIPTPTTNDLSIEEDDEDDNIQDPFPTELPPPEPDSPPLPMSLCPITGKVLLKAEGEKTPPPSPDPVQNVPEEKTPELKFDVKEMTTTHQQENDQEKMDELNNQTIHQLQPMTNEDGTPLIVTGEDGTIYQIAGKNEEGQTILIAQGSDGEQQCVYVAAQEDDEGVLALEGGGDVGQLIPQQEGMEEEQTQYILKQDGDNPNAGQTLTLSLEGGDSQDAHITAEVVQAELPSPGGTRRVVLLLPDGNFMMTEVDEEQYRSLNIAA